MTMTERIRFKIKNDDILYEYIPWNNDTYLVKSWFENMEQPEKFIKTREAMMTYDYCSSMWIDYDVEVIK